MVVVLEMGGGVWYGVVFLRESGVTVRVGVVSRL